MTIFSATGHRPDKLGGYTAEVDNRLCSLAHKAIVHEMMCRPRGDIKFVISGMAQGWDTAIAKAALLAQVPLIAAVPFAGQESKWPDSSKRVYAELLRASSLVLTISDGGYAGWKMHFRNEFMVRTSDQVLALWNGAPDGGTAACVALAHKTGKPVTNLWNEWIGSAVAVC